MAAARPTFAFTQLYGALKQPAQGWHTMDTVPSTL
jgi:hypothetical protein